MSSTKLQYNLSSLLWFVLAFAAYASQLAFRFDPDWGADWRTPVTVVVSFVILGTFYLAKDLRELFAVHCMGPASYITLAMIFLPEERSFLKKLTDGCLFGNQLAFAIFIAIIVGHVLIYVRQRIRERRKEAELLLMGHREEADSFHGRERW